jgi:hypothetical protein
VTKNQTRILEILTANPTAMTSREIAAEAGVTAPTALKNAEKLLKLGLIERGPSRGNAYTFQAGEVEAVGPAAPTIEPGKVECQVCEGHFTEDKNGALWNHGYKRPGWGWLVGGCMGVGYEPYPMTNALERYLAAVGERQEVVNKTLGARDTWPTLSYQVRVGNVWSKKTKTVTIERPTQADTDAIEAAYAAWKATEGQDWATVQKPLHTAWVKLHDAKKNWESRHASQVWRLETEAKQLASEVERVTARIARGKADAAS